MESQQTPAQKNASARRRAKRSVNSPAARKNYASENDIPSCEPSFPLEPFTPKKSVANSPALSSQPAQAKSKPRNGNKSRPRQVTSPGPSRQGRTTPPNTAPSKPAAAQAFAGGTFHASPAPSSLPIPSFLSKALDSPSVQAASRAGREPSPPATDTEAAPTPQHRVLTAYNAHEESPLDIFFRADRAEKERARRASSANIYASTPGFHSPAAHVNSPSEPRTVPNGLFGNGRDRRPGYQRNPSSGISISELDGTPGRPLGPAFATPYQERIRAARASDQQQRAPAPVPAVAQSHVPTEQPASTSELTEKLKRFLAISPVQGQNGVQQQPQQLSPPFLFAPAQITPSSTSSVPSASAVSTSAMGSESITSRSPDIRQMEDSLRRILKLDSGNAIPQMAKEENRHIQ
ncbi:uncharacterized protein CTHT_0023600 [Thermochaetoides thermophila DSM 1495]|uniref:Proteophosphoglycan 5 n=1 Tax=Chaetomium thermophilum (strain DSM 1495 / CBS 144.50 / IMI 039719) TaxID=759272 RepID=G0S502_CHATD|nr:hypothetical protein CTHT_0023600 [Thermochaetoides thermophila DSM 1495]EGS20527.1 hypothetical protein CTHT_0023600 [Thermochaetoides thermophila DSM 1495]